MNRFAALDENHVKDSGRKSPHQVKSVHPSRKKRADTTSGDHTTVSAYVQDMNWCLRGLFFGNCTNDSCKGEHLTDKNKVWRLLNKLIQKPLFCTLFRDNDYNAAILEQSQKELGIARNKLSVKTCMHALKGGCRSMHNGRCFTLTIGGETVQACYFKMNAGVIQVGLHLDYELALVRGGRAKVDTFIPINFQLESRSVRASEKRIAPQVPPTSVDFPIMPASKPGTKRLVPLPKEEENKLWGGHIPPPPSPEKLEESEIAESKAVSLEQVVERLPTSISERDPELTTAEVAQLRMDMEERLDEVHHMIDAFSMQLTKMERLFGNKAADEAAARLRPIHRGGVLGTVKRYNTYDYFTGDPDMVSADGEYSESEYADG